MNEIGLGVILTILFTIIGYMIKLSTQVQKNSNKIIEESTRSITEDRHHQGELTEIKNTLRSIKDNIDALTKELLGNGKS